MMDLTLKTALIGPEEFSWYRDFLPDHEIACAADDERILFFGIQMGSVACGAVVLRDEGLNAALRHIYIAPDYRGYHLGEQVIADLAERLRDAGFETLTMCYQPERQPAAARVAERLGFTEKENGRGSFSFRLGDFAEDARLKKINTDHVKTLGDVRRTERAALYAGLRKAGLDFTSLPPEDEDLVPELCFAAYETEPVGLFLVRRVVEPGLEVFLDIFYFAYMGKKVSGFAEMFAAFLKTASVLYTPDLECRFSSVNPDLTAASERLLGLTAEKEVTATMVLNDYRDVRGYYPTAEGKE